MYKKLAVALAGFVMAFSAAFAVACDDDDTIGENIDQALETVDQVGEDVGEEVETQVNDIGDDDETPGPTDIPEPTNTPNETGGTGGTP